LDYSRTHSITFPILWNRKFLCQDSFNHSCHGHLGTTQLGLPRTVSTTTVHLSIRHKQSHLPENTFTVQFCVIIASLFPPKGGLLWHAGLC
jgi:hypothetical protein